MSDLTQERRVALRALIEQFLVERLEGELKKLQKLEADDPKREAGIAREKARHQYATWLEDAARRVRKMQAVTHTIKAVHSSANGTSIYSPPGNQLFDGLVGTHCLSEDFAYDVVVNAADLDVSKFLKLTHEKQSLLRLMLIGDTDLAAILNDDLATAQAWIESFTRITRITRPNANLASHARAKQVYWLVGEDPLSDADYHLLAPLYASSLAHQIYQTLQDNRFGEEAEEARQARRDKLFHPGVIHDYPDLALQKLGGSNPQNISQLNSERSGENYLLASLPPIWKAQSVSLPIRTATGSIFQGFTWREEVSALVTTLRAFLEGNPEPTMSTRNTRDKLVSCLIDELLIYAAEIQNGPSGWSQSLHCNLRRAEQLWLDPRRAAQDEAFAFEWKQMEWVGDIRHAFGNWLNEQLRRQLSVGDTEYLKWSSDLASDALWLDMLELDQQWLEQFECDQKVVCEDAVDE